MPAKTVNGSLVVTAVFLWEVTVNSVLGALVVTVVVVEEVVVVVMVVDSVVVVVIEDVLDVVDSVVGVVSLSVGCAAEKLPKSKTHTSAATKQTAPAVSHNHLFLSSFTNPPPFVILHTIIAHHRGNNKGK